MKTVKNVVVVLLIICSLAIVGCSKPNDGVKFEYWNESESLTALKNYVETVTDQKSN